MVKKQSVSGEIHIRKAAAPDAQTLAELGRLSFEEAFSDRIAPRNMQDHLQAAFNPATVMEQLRAEGSLFLVLESGPMPVGYAYLYPNKPPECVQEVDPLQLIRFYLRRSYYGRGLGNKLMQACLKEARSRGYRSIWLSSWELNERANSFYRKWDFKIVGRQKFTVGSDVQDDVIFMRKILRRDNRDAETTI